MSVETSKDGHVAETKVNLRFELMMHKGILLLKGEPDEIRKLEMRDDDIWVCSFPRSGKRLSVCLSVCLSEFLILTVFNFRYRRFK